MRILCCVVSLVAALDAQDGDAAELLAEAKAVLREGDADRATVKLWEAERLLDPFAPGDAALRDAIGALLAETDPLHDERLEVRKEIAGELLDLTRAYIRKKWYRTAQDLLLETAAHDPGTAGTVRSYLGKKLAGAGPAAPPVEEADTEKEEEKDLLDRLDSYPGSPEWQRLDGAVVSPAIEEEGAAMLIEDAQLHGDHRIAVEVRRKNVVGSCALLFGVRNGKEYLLAELKYGGKKDRCHLELTRRRGVRGLRGAAPGAEAADHDGGGAGPLRDPGGPRPRYRGRGPAGRRPPDRGGPGGAGARGRGAAGLRDEAG